MIYSSLPKRVCHGHYASVKYLVGSPAFFQLLITLAAAFPLVEAHCCFKEGLQMFKIAG